MAVEKLGGGLGEDGGGGDIVHLEEHGRGGHGGVAEAGASEGGEGRVGGDEVAR